MKKYNYFTTYVLIMLSIILFNLYYFTYFNNIEYFEESDDAQPNDSQPDDSQPDDSKPDDSQPDDSQPDGSKSTPYENEPLIYFSPEVQSELDTLTTNLITDLNNTDPTTIPTLKSLYPELLIAFTPILTFITKIKDVYDLNPVEFDQNIERVIKFINTKIIENKSHENNSDEIVLQLTKDDIYNNISSIINLKNNNKDAMQNINVSDFVKKKDIENLITMNEVQNFLKNQGATF